MIPVYKPLITENTKKYVNDCLESSWISSKGEYVDKFEKKFADFTNNKHVTSVCNGTVAIHLALKAIGITKGDEVIVPTYTYVATVNMIKEVGAIPVYVDSLENTWQINHKDIESKITDKTKAVFVVHIYGHPCQMDKISEICQNNNLLLIEDCAEALGSFFKKKHVGCFGDLATYSFFGNKTLTTGEGGMVCCKSEIVYKKLKKLKNQGISNIREYYHDELAYNYRMTNICAAIGLSQIEDIYNILQLKRNLAEKYCEKLRDLPLIFHTESIDTTHSFWMCSIRVADEKTRDKLRKYLLDFKIETRPGFDSSHTLPHLKSDETFLVAENLSKTVINLPSWPELSNKDSDFIIEKVKTFYNEA